VMPPGNRYRAGICDHTSSIILVWFSKPNYMWSLTSSPEFMETCELINLIAQPVLPVRKKRKWGWEGLDFHLPICNNRQPLQSHSNNESHCLIDNFINN
jgi:hypothetical protein